MNGRTMRRALAMAVGGILLAALVPGVADAAAMKVVKLDCDSANNWEYVDIRNTGTSTKDLTGWKVNDYKKLHTYKFPAGYKLGAGKTVRIWSGGGSGGPYAKWIKWTNSTIWNDTGDKAALRNPSGTAVSVRVCDDVGGP